MTVLAPFARSGGARYPLADLVSDAGATLRPGAIASVDPASREVHTAEGETLAYDALLIAVGGIQQFPFPRALAYGGPGADERMHGLVQDVEAGYVKRTKISGRELSRHLTPITARGKELRGTRANQP